MLQIHNGIYAIKQFHFVTIMMKCIFIVGAWCMLPVDSTSEFFFRLQKYELHEKYVFPLSSKEIDPINALSLSLLSTTLLYRSIVVCRYGAR